LTLALNMDQPIPHTTLTGMRVGINNLKNRSKK